MIWSARPDGYRDFYNDRWYDFTGAPRGSTDGQNWKHVVHPDDLERVASHWRHALRTGDPVEVQYRLKHHEGGYRWACARAMAERDEAGEIIRWYGTTTDINEQVLAEEKFAALQANVIHIPRVNAMGAMAATIAHELNQPLAAIGNYAAGADNLIARGVPCSELAHPLAEINRMSERAGDIIRRLREMTRNGKITKVPFIPDAVIKEAGVLASVGACASIDLRYDFRDGLPVMGDPIQVQQILINLIRNACEAVAKGKVRNVRVLTEIHGDETLVSVEDSGPGISPDVLPTLFDAFCSTKDDGMGVGLSISRTIIEAHGGKIWAENPPEGGARFSFYLPLADKRPG